MPGSCVLASRLGNGIHPSPCGGKDLDEHFGNGCRRLALEIDAHACPHILNQIGPAGQLLDCNMRV